MLRVRVVVFEFLSVAFVNRSLGELHVTGLSQESRLVAICYGLVASLQVSSHQHHQSQRPRPYTIHNHC